MTPAQQTTARAMTEATLQRAVLDLAKILGLLAFHDQDSRRNQAGFPDLVIVGKRVVFLELKTEIGKLRPDQEKWVTRLALAGERVLVVRPSDWVTGKVQTLLKELR